MDRITLPLKTVSEINTRCHWATRAKRSCLARDLARVSVISHFCGSAIPVPPLTVILVRVAPRKLDGDNLRSALKAVRDGVADAILAPNRGNQSRKWADDSSGEIAWRYGQANGKAKQYQVIILIEREKRGEIENEN